MTIDNTSKPTRVVYVLGTQRGGTTILGRVLGTIEGFSYAGELRDLWTVRPKRDLTCGCGKSHADCEVWSEVHARLDSRLSELVLLGHQVMPARHSWWRGSVRHVGHGDRASSTARYAQLISDVYGSFAKASGADVVVDSSKHPGDAALLAGAPGIAVSYVQIVRDPRGVVFDAELRRSRRARVRGSGSAPFRPRYLHPLGAIRGGLAWDARHIATESVRRAAGPERGLLIRYEDFCANPERTLTAVARLAAQPLEWPAPSDDRTFHLPTAHTPNGSGRRTAADIRLTEDERWTEQLPGLDRALIGLVSAPRRRRYGYPMTVGGSR